MILHPDGRVEGTPEELAAFERAKACGACSAIDAEAIRKALEDTAEHIKNHPPFVLPPNWPLPTGPTTIYPNHQGAAVDDWYERCGCNPKNGGSGVCMCVRPERDGVRCGP